MATGSLLVTGGGGFLGRCVLRLAAAAGIDVVAPTSAVLDIRDAGAVDDCVRTVRPIAIAHLAYRVHERDTIVDGSANVARAAERVGARLVHVSTDVVFAGRAAPYTEVDRPDPVYEYGAAKADAERAVAELHPAAVLVRTSLLYAADLRDPGAPVEAVRAALADPASSVFFTDEVRCPALVDDVATAVVALAGDAALSDVTGPLHVTGDEAITRFDFARAIADWLGSDGSVLRSGTHADLGLVRPRRLVLDNSTAASLGLPCRGVSRVL
ncbi:MAG: NAD(P)-dependent oxidoreductase [Acidimicrobiia bacterium]